MMRHSFDVLYKKLVENVNEAIWMGDAEEKTIYANPKFCELVGYSLEEMLGQESYIFWDEESAKRVKHVNTTHRKKGESTSYEGNLLTKTGKTIPVLLNGTPLPDGGTIGIMTDLTELKKERRSAYLLNNAVQNASVAIIILDDQGRVTTWNQGAKDLLGYKAKEVQGISITEIIPDPRITLGTTKITSVHRMVAEAINKKGKNVKIGLTFNPIVLPDRSGHAFLLIGRDISIQNRLQEDIDSRFDKIREAYEQMGLVKRQMEYMAELMDSNLENRKETINFIVTSLIIISKADACTLRVYNPQRDSVDLVGSYGISDEWKGKVTVPFKGSLTEKAFNERKVLRIVNISEDPLYESTHLAQENSLTSAMIIPLVVKGNFIGKITLYIGADKSLDLFENEFIERYAKLVAIILPQLGHHA